MNKRSICDFAGAKKGIKPVYQQAARILGKTLASRRIELIYGGASVGLMGTVAEATLEAGGTVTGIIPSQGGWLEDENHHALTQVLEVTTMHERKATMTQLADMFLALPGGLGTFDELFEILTWKQLGLHQKPIGLCNIAGYFDPFKTLIEHTIEQGFCSVNHSFYLEGDQQALVIEDDDIIHLLDRLEHILGS